MPLRLRVDDEHRITPRLALVIAVGGEEIRIRPVLSARPAGPQPTAFRGLHARRHGKGPILLPIVGHRIEDELRRDMDAVEKLLRDFDGGLRRDGWLVELVHHLLQADGTGDVPP